MATALCSVGDVKTAAGITASTHDAQLADLIGQVSDQMERWMGRVIGFEVHASEAYSGDGFSDSILLNYGPLIPSFGVGAVVLDGVTLDSGDYSAPTSLRPDEGRTLYYSPSGTAAAWPRGRRNVVVTYSTGWSTVPSGLELAAIDEVRSRFSLTTPGGGPGKFDIVSQSSDQKGSVTYEKDPSGFLVRTVAAMRPYRMGTAWL